MKITAFVLPSLPRALRRALPGRAGRKRLVLAVLGLALVACDDPFEPRWVAAPDTVLLYSLSRPEPNLPSGFNFNFRTPVLIEAPGSTGQWDLALDTAADDLVFLPPGALGINSRARIAPLRGVDFEAVREAPADTAVYVSDRALPVEANTVYVVQTNQVVGSFGQRCVYFAKVEAVEIDVPSGTLRFLFDANPVCNDPRLVPPDG